MHNELTTVGGFGVELVEGLGLDREDVEREARAAGFALPLSHTLAWSRSMGSATDLLLVFRNAQRECRGVIALERARSRALPGHVLVRAQRVGAALAPEADEAVPHALVALARVLPRVLRVSIELFGRDAERREAIALSLADVGFRTSPSPRSYAQTLTLELDGDEAALLARLPAKTRRDVRAPSKHGLDVRAITDVALASRLDELFRETMARSGGPYHRYDWPALIRMAERHPDRVRIVGLFRENGVSPASPIAFSVGYGHGDHAEYHLAASTRVKDLKVPLAYALLWDLVMWARRFGATWFDFGGVTPAQLGDAGALGGISDFKRYFSKTCETVGEEWILEPRRARAELANAVSAGAAWLTAVRAGA